MKYTILLLITMLSASIFAQTGDEDLDVLVEYMTGSFTSTEQAAQHEDYDDISLHIAPVWKNLWKGVAYLYVQQELAENPEKPLLQEIYHIRKVADYTYAIDKYRLPNEQSFIGAWKNPEAFDALQRGAITKNVGCTIYIEYDAFASFEGLTDEKYCESNLNGASYSTSEITVLENEIIAWDRGYDANHLQVWGAERGGYHFKKK